MSSEDLELAYEIEKECFSPDEAFSKDQYRRLLASPTVIKFKASSEGVMAGFIVGVDHNGEGEIHTVNVRTNFRRKGIATTLIQALERTFLARGCKIVVAEISPDNEPSKGLFKGLGYRQIRVLRDFYRRGKPAIQVEKSLAP